MSDEARAWLRYAEENLQSAQLLLQSALFNPALQHAQQAVEKFLKAVLMARTFRCNGRTVSWHWSRRR